jgi:hypothetical protein
VATFEKTGTVAAGTNLSGFAGAAATGIIGVGLAMTVRPAGPELGYHLAHDYHDPYGGLVVGFGFAALYAILRAVRLKDIL